MTRSNIRPLSTAMDVVGKLLFECGYSMNDILVTKDVYPETAKRMGKKTGAVSKSIERLSRICWDAMVEQDLVTLFVGRSQKYAPSPRDLLVYLAVYARIGRSFFELAEEYPELLFHSPSGIEFLLGNEYLEETSVRGVGADAPLLMICRLGESYSVIPVCKRCMDVLERERLSFCASCGMCGEVVFASSKTTEIKV